MIKRLIFDVDGTLITNVDFDYSIEKTLKQLNIYSEDNLKKFLAGIKLYENKFSNYNRNDYIKHFEEVLNEKLPDNFLDIFFENLKLAIPKKDLNLIETIKLLAEKYELVLLTNYFSISQLNRLKEMGIGEYFIACYGENLIKPDFNAYINACGNNKPCECVMIGDDIYLDIEKAQEVGLKTILVNTRNLLDLNIETLAVQSVCEITEEIIKNL